MSLAYVFLKCDNGTEKQVLNEINTVEGVKETLETFGPFGAVVKIESNNENKVKQILNEKIRCIDGIHSSMTLVAPYDDYNNEPQPAWEEIRGLSWMFYED